MWKEGNFALRLTAMRMFVLDHDLSKERESEAFGIHTCLPKIESIVRCYHSELQQNGPSHVPPFHNTIDIANPDIITNSLDKLAGFDAAPWNGTTGPEAEALALAASKLMVSDPITKPPLPTLIGTPLIVMPEPPLLNVLPSTSTAPFGSMVTTCPSVVMTESVELVRGMVFGPIMRPAEPTLIGVPLIVVPGPPLLKVMPSTAINPLGSIVNTWLSVVTTLGGGVCRGMVLVPMMKPPDPTLMGVPLIVVPGPPLLKVIPLIAIILLGSIVYTCPSAVMAAGVGVGKRIVLLPTIREPEGFNDMEVLLTVMPGPPADKVAPATANLVGLAVNVSPPTV